MINKKILFLLIISFLPECLFATKTITKIHPSRSKVVLSKEIFYQKILPTLKNKKLMLVTNPSGIGVEPETILSEFQKYSVEIVNLLGLEHGFLGLEEDFGQSPVTIDPLFKKPVYHAYRINSQELATITSEVDVIVLDVQDMGMRCYTYITVLKRLIDAIRDKPTQLIVLDHLHPALHLKPRGEYIEKDLENFAGEFPSPLFTGLTMGEAAIFYEKEFSEKRAKVQVISPEGISRNSYFEELGISWSTPSPNLPTLESARNYLALVLLEGINVSVGRGTQAPFVYFGAPWMENPNFFAEFLNEKLKEDVHFAPVFFKPVFGPYKGQICKGLRMNLINIHYDPIKTSYVLIEGLRKFYKTEFKWNKGNKYSVDSLWGNSHFRKSIESEIPYEKFAETIEKDEKDFYAKSKKYRLY